MFFQVLYLVSIVPYLIFPLLFAGKVLPNTEQVRQTILFLGNAHIAITLYFYWDRPFAAIIRRHRIRYIVAPVVAIVISGVSYALTPDRFSFVWFSVYMLWQNWHFGRQTFGVYAFVGMDQTPGTKISRFERSLIYMSVVAGAGGVLSIVSTDTEFQRLALNANIACGYVTLVLSILGAGYVVYARSKFNANRAIFFLFSLLFFAPEYLHRSVEIGFSTYSVSHSLQYLFFMSIIAFCGQEAINVRRSQLPPSLMAVLLFAGIVLIGGSVIAIRGEFGTWLTTLTGSVLVGKFVTGAMFGLVVAHFVVDARAWRLRDAEQREFVLGRFNFLPPLRPNPTLVPAVPSYERIEV